MDLRGGIKRNIRASSFSKQQNNTMLPTHYLHILLGVMPGFAIGFFAASILAAWRMRRISAREWLAARKFYTRETSQKIAR